MPGSLVCAIRAIISRDIARSSLCSDGEGAVPQQRPPPPPPPQALTSISLGWGWGWGGHVQPSKPQRLFFCRAFLHCDESSWRECKFSASDFEKRCLSAKKGRIFLHFFCVLSILLSLSEWLQYVLKLEWDECGKNALANFHETTFC